MHKIIKYISSGNHLHIGMYDAMNHCRKFEEILMRTVFTLTYINN